MNPISSPKLDSKNYGTDDFASSGKLTGLEISQFQINLNSSIDNFKNKKEDTAPSPEKENFSKCQEDVNNVPIQNQQVTPKNNDADKQSDLKHASYEEDNKNFHSEKQNRLDNIATDNESDKTAETKGESKETNKLFVNTNIHQLNNSRQKISKIAKKSSVEKIVNKLNLIVENNQAASEGKKVSSLGKEISKDLTSMYVNIKTDDRTEKATDKSVKQELTKSIADLTSKKTDLNNKSKQDSSGEFKQYDYDKFERVKLNNGEEKVVVSNKVFEQNLMQSKPISFSTPASQVVTYQDVRFTELTQKTTQIINNLQENTTQLARLILKPASLGTIFVEVSLNNNNAKLNFKADSKEVAKNLESQLDILKDKLAGNGIKLESVNIGHKEQHNDVQYQSYQQSGQERKEDKKPKKNIFKMFDNLKNSDNTDELLSGYDVAEQGRS